LTKSNSWLNFCRAVPGFIQFEDLLGDWKLLEAAFAMYSDMFADPVIVVKSEYQLWCCKWEQQPAENRPKSTL
jgi:hypothetical protein